MSAEAQRGEARGGRNPSANDQRARRPGWAGVSAASTRSIARTKLSASGRRLFFEADVDDVIRSNVIQYVYGDS